MIVSRNQAVPFHFDLFFDLEEEPHFSHPLASFAILLWAIYRCIYKELSLLELGQLEPKVELYLLSCELLKAFILHHLAPIILPVSKRMRLFSKRTAAEPKSQNIFTHVLSDQNSF